MELEKIATSAVVAELSRTDRLSSFINSGDKEPCWDGSIYIHEDKSRTKKNIKKVATQIKGKAVRQKQVKRTISYSIAYNDLHAYMMNGGTMFFVVYIDEISGTPLQVYYTGLLPVKIKELFKAKKGKYSVKFRKFPNDNLQKTELLLNFYEDARRQASFAGKDLPTIDDLAKEGVLESLTIHYTGLGCYDSRTAFPRVLDGHPLTIYANIKGGSAPIPVEYIEEVSHIVMSRSDEIPVSVNGKPFYSDIQIVTTSDSIEYRIGSSVKITAPNADKELDSATAVFSIHIQGSLNQQIAAIEFVSAMIEHGSFCIGTKNIPMSIPQKELDKIRYSSFPEVLKAYKRIKAVLTSMNVKKDLQIDKCSSEDIEKLNLLIRALGTRQPVEATPESPASVQKLTIANLTLAVVFLPAQDGFYNIYDYFGMFFEVSWAPDGMEPAAVSQFFSMGVDDYLTLDNLNLKTVVEDFRRVNVSVEHLELGNNAMLAMLKAYDKQPSAELLDAAFQLCEWQQEYPEMIPANITTLNRLQIALRKRALTFQEKSDLYNIATASTDVVDKIGAFLLLDEQKEASSLLDTLSENDLTRFKEFPIFKFYRAPEEDSKNG